MPKQLLLIVMLLAMAVFNIDAQSDAFITTWNTGVDGGITIPIQEGYDNNYHVVVKNAETEVILSEQDVTGSFTISELSANIEITVAITGNFPAICMYHSTQPKELLSIDQWGSIQWKSMWSAFYECTNMTITATDKPDLSDVTDISYMFYGASSFNADLSGWDVSNVTDMIYLFNNARSFNSDLSGWDVSKVTNMKGLFYGATSFDGDLSEWEMGNVTNMHAMFYGDVNFNGDLSSWDVSSVTDMSHMFYNATSFNGNLSSWDVSSVTNMNGMFYNNTNFNGNISTWDMSHVLYMSYMFYGASSFNGDLSSWDVSTVQFMNGVFNKASSFNGDLSSWDVSNVVEMKSMFCDASSFTQDLSQWSAKVDVDNSSMFSGAGDTYYTITYHVNDSEYLGFYPAGHANIVLRSLGYKNGLAFYGWNTASDFTGDTLISIDEEVTGDLSLYATWSTSTEVDKNEVSVISYYPNPVINQLHIEGLEGDYDAGILYNVAGVMVTKFNLSLQQGDYQVDMSNYFPGIYLLQLHKTDGSTESVRILKK